MTPLAAVFFGAVVVFGVLLGLFLAFGRRNPDSCDGCGRADLPLYVVDGELLCDGCRFLATGEGPHAA